MACIKCGDIYEGRVVEVVGDSVRIQDVGLARLSFGDYPRVGQTVLYYDCKGRRYVLPENDLGALLPPPEDTRRDGVFFRRSILYSSITPEWIRFNGARKRYPAEILRTVIYEYEGGGMYSADPAIPLDFFGADYPFADPYNITPELQARIYPMAFVSNLAQLEYLAGLPPQTFSNLDIHRLEQIGGNIYKPFAGEIDIAPRLSHFPRNRWPLVFGNFPYMHGRNDNGRYYDAPIVPLNGMFSLSRTPLNTDTVNVGIDGVSAYPDVIAQYSADVSHVYTLPSDPSLIAPPDYQSRFADTGFERIDKGELFREDAPMPSQLEVFRVTRSSTNVPVVRLYEDGAQTTLKSLSAERMRITFPDDEFMYSTTIGGSAGGSIPFTTCGRDGPYAGYFYNLPTRDKPGQLVQADNNYDGFPCEFTSIFGARGGLDACFARQVGLNLDESLAWQMANRPPDFIDSTVRPWFSGAINDSINYSPMFSGEVLRISRKSETPNASEIALLYFYRWMDYVFFNNTGLGYNNAVGNNSALGPRASYTATLVGGTGQISTLVRLLFHRQGEKMTSPPYTGTSFPTLDRLNELGEPQPYSLNEVMRDVFYTPEKIASAKAFLSTFSCPESTEIRQTTGELGTPVTFRLNSEVFTRVRSATFDYDGQPVRHCLFDTYAEVFSEMRLDTNGTWQRINSVEYDISRYAQDYIDPVFDGIKLDDRIGITNDIAFYSQEIQEMDAQIVAIREAGGDPPQSLLDSLARREGFLADVLSDFADKAKLQTFTIKHDAKQLEYYRVSNVGSYTPESLVNDYNDGRVIFDGELGTLYAPNAGKISTLGGLTFNAGCADWLKVGDATYTIAVSDGVVQIASDGEKVYEAPLTEWLGDELASRIQGATPWQHYRFLSESHPFETAALEFAFETDGLEDSWKRVIVTVRPRLSGESAPLVPTILPTDDAYYWHAVPLRPYAFGYTLPVNATTLLTRSGRWQDMFNVSGENAFTFATQSEPRNGYGVILRDIFVYHGGDLAPTAPNYTSLDVPLYGYKNEGLKLTLLRVIDKAQADNETTVLITGTQIRGVVALEDYYEYA